MNSPTCIFNLCCLLVFHSAFWVTCLICFYLILTVFKANWLTSLKANLSSLLLGLFFSPTLREKLCQCCLTSLCISNLSVKPILYSASFAFSNCWECARWNTLIWKQFLCDVILWFTLIYFFFLESSLFCFLFKAHTKTYGSESWPLTHPEITSRGSIRWLLLSPSRHWTVTTTN